MSAQPSIFAVPRNTFFELCESEESPPLFLPRRRAFSESAVDLLHASEPSSPESAKECCESSDTASTTASWDESSDGESESSGSFVAESDVSTSVIAVAPAPARPLIRRQKVEPWSISAANAASESERTTLVLKSLPAGCSREDLRSNLDEAGFAGCYNFMYLPAHLKSWTLFQYAFVNFLTPADALRAIDKLNGAQWPGSADREPLVAVWSEMHQGLDVHIERYRNSPLMHNAVPDEYKPIFLRDGLRVKFPRPTQRTAPPRSLPGRQQRRATC